MFLLNQNAQTLANDLLDLYGKPVANLVSIETKIFQTINALKTYLTAQNTATQICVASVSGYFKGLIQDPTDLQFTLNAKMINVNGNNGNGTSIFISGVLCDSFAFLVPVGVDLNCMFHCDIFKIRK